MIRFFPRSSTSLLTIHQSHHRTRLLPLHAPLLPPLLLHQPPLSPPPLPGLQTGPPRLGPLLRHLPHRQHGRHLQIHRRQPARLRHDLGPHQIRRHQHGEHVALPSQGQSIRQDVRRRHGVGSEAGPSADGELCTLRAAGLLDHLCEFQSAPAHRADAAHDGRGGEAGESGECGAVPCACGDPAAEHAVAFVGVGSV